MDRGTKKRVSLKDVANAVGVNVSTVSRALNPSSDHPISKELTDHIRKTSKKLGYRPNAAAYSLRTSITKTIGVVLPDITDPVFPPIIRGIEAGLEKYGYVSIVANTDNDERRETKVIETLNSRGVDGFILATAKRKLDHASSLTEGRPIVTVTRRADDPLISSVVHDEEEGIRRLMNHLVSLGHRDIATIAGPQAVSTGFMRYSAFERHRKELGLGTTATLSTFAKTFTEEEGERCAEELLVRNKKFTAVICANDRLAIGAIAAFQRRGLRCPDDVSVTGFNDMPLADRLQPPLTTIRIQHYKAGVQAADLIVEILDGGESKSEPIHLVLPIEMIVRGSTKLAKK